MMRKLVKILNSNNRIKLMILLGNK